MAVFIAKLIVLGAVSPNGDILGATVANGTSAETADNSSDL